MRKLFFPLPTLWCLRYFCWKALVPFTRPQHTPSLYPNWAGIVSRTVDRDVMQCNSRIIAPSRSTYDEEELTMDRCSWYFRENALFLTLDAVLGKSFASSCCNVFKKKFIQPFLSFPFVACSSEMHFQCDLIHYHAQYRYLHHHHHRLHCCGWGLQQPSLFPSKRSRRSSSAAYKNQLMPVVMSLEYIYWIVDHSSRSRLKLELAVSINHRHAGSSVGNCIP